MRDEESAFHYDVDVESFEMSCRACGVEFVGVAFREMEDGSRKEIYLPDLERMVREEILQFKRVKSACDYLASHATGTERHILLRMSEEMKAGLLEMLAKSCVDKRLGEIQRESMEKLSRMFSSPPPEPGRMH